MLSDCIKKYDAGAWETVKGSVQTIELPIVLERRIPVWIWHVIPNLSYENLISLDKPTLIFTHDSLMHIETSLVIV